jgi:hypothetical protein
MFLRRSDRDRFATMLNQEAYADMQGRRERFDLSPCVGAMDSDYEHGRLVGLARVQQPPATVDDRRRT